jgi:hypothetical protein
MTPRGAKGGRVVKLRSEKTKRWILIPAAEVILLLTYGTVASQQKTLLQTELPQKAAGYLTVKVNAGITLYWVVYTFFKIAKEFSLKKRR